MYELQTISPETLSKVTITRQEEILERTGSRLDLRQALALLRKETDGFTQKKEAALEADALLMQLLQRDGAVPSTPVSATEKQSNRLRLQAAATAKALELLELELQLAA